MGFKKYKEEKVMKMKTLPIKDLKAYLDVLCEMKKIPNDYKEEFLLEVFTTANGGVAMTEHKVFDYENGKGFMKDGVIGAFMRGDGTVDILMYVFEAKFETKKKWFSGISTKDKDQLQKYCQHRSAVNYKEKKALSIEES